MQRVEGSRFSPRTALILPHTRTHTRTHNTHPQITFSFADVGLFTGGAGAVRVHSVYEDTTLATTNASSFTVSGIPWQGTVLLRLSSVQQQ